MSLMDFVATNAEGLAALYCYTLAAVLLAFLIWRTT